MEKEALIKDGSKEIDFTLPYRQELPSSGLIFIINKDKWVVPTSPKSKSSEIYLNHEIISIHPWYLPILLPSRKHHARPNVIFVLADDLGIGDVSRLIRIVKSRLRIFKRWRMKELPLWMPILPVLFAHPQDMECLLVATIGDLDLHAEY